MEIFRLTGNIVIDGVNTAESALSSLGSSLSNLGNTISQVGNSLIENISKPIVDLISTGISYRATIEDLETSFGVLLNSQGKAADLMGDIRELSRTTPFETESLGLYTQSMLAMGYTQNEVLDIMSRLGDVSLGNKVKMNTLTDAMGKCKAMGKLQGQELTRLQDTGFTPLQIIAQKTGETMDELRERMRNGNISYAELEEALKSATNEGGRFHDGMAKGSLTLNGIISTLKDTFREFAAEISKPVFTKLKEIVPQVTSVLTNLSEKFNNLSENGKLVILGLGGLTAAFPLLIVGVGTVITGLGVFVLLMSSLLNPVTLVAGAIGILISGAALGGLITMLANLPNINLEQWKSSFDSFKNKATEIYSYFVDTWKPAIKYLLTDDPVELAKIKDEDFRNSIEGLRTSIEKLSNDVKTKVNEIAKAFKDIDKKDVANFSKSLAEIATSLVKIANVTGGAISKLKEFYDAFNNADAEIMRKPTKKLDLDLILDDSKAKAKIKKSNDDIKLDVEKQMTGNKPLTVDAIVNDINAKSKIDFSNQTIQQKANNPIENVIKAWGTDAIINDASANSKIDFSNQTLKTKSIEIIPNVLKSWQTDSNINDNPAKTKTDASNQSIKAKASEVIPNQTKNFSLFANIDVSGALSSIGNAFSNITSKISSYSSSIFANIRIPGFATGVTNYSGGLAMVGENGPELVNLPKGSDVYTANETKRMLNTPQGLNNNSSQNVFNVTIDARNIKDFNDVINIFSRIKTEKITRLGGI